MKPWRWAAASLAAVGVLGPIGLGIAAEVDLADRVAAYLKARDERAVGEVTGRAYAEPKRLGAAPEPYPSVSVVLLPYSAAFEAQLDAIKAGLRDSVDNYIRAVARVESARVDYEGALLAAGGGELVRTEVTDADGGVRLRDLPVGDWLLLAWRESGHASKRFNVRESDARHYPDVPTNVTYSMVTYWRARVTVRPAEAAEVALNDRSVWMTAARQESGTPVQRRPPGTTNPQRR